MTDEPTGAAGEVAEAVAEYRVHDNLGALLDALRAVGRRYPAAELRRAAEPFGDLHEVTIPIYERVIELDPADTAAMVRLANSYWLTGRGPDVVSGLAERAIATDPANRGAWHLWALSEPEIRTRVERWERVARQFPEDQLARAALADNATSLASEERDPLALDLAIRTYEGLLAEADGEQTRTALTTALETLRAWRV